MTEKLNYVPSTNDTFWQFLTRGITVDEPAESASVIMKCVKPLLAKTEAGDKKVRLLGISVSNFDDQEIKAEIYR